MMSIITLTSCAILAMFTGIGIYSTRRTVCTPEGSEYPATLAGVSSLVTSARSGLASSPGPLPLIRARDACVTAALLMILTGLGTVLLWHEVLQYEEYAFAALPVMMAGFAVYGMLWLLFLRHEQAHAQ